MADTKISSLTAKTTLGDSDLVPIVDIEATPDETKKITVANVKTQIVNSTTVNSAGAVMNSDGLSVSNDGTKTTVVGQTGDYNRIGEGGTTAHSLDSENDLMVTGEHEVKGASFLDGAVTVGSTVDGRDLDTDGTKLDTVDTNADVTGSNAPQAHTASHQNGGGDEVSVTGLSGLLADDQHVLDTEVQAIKLDDFTAPDDNTDLDFSTSVHGLVPKGTDVGDFLKDDGTWSTPAGAGDVTGPGSSTDNMIARHHETGGKTLQDYTSNAPTISDTGDMNVDGNVDCDNVVIADAGNIGSASAIDAIAINAAGVLTLAKQSRARAYPSADQSIHESAYTYIILDTEDFDEQNEFTTSTTDSTATASTAGVELYDDTDPFVAGDVGKIVWNINAADSGLGKSATIETYHNTDHVTLKIDIEIDDGDDYRFGVSRFTATTAGRYAITFTGTIQNLGDGKKIMVYAFKNGVGAAYSRTTVGGTDYVAMSGAAILDLSANDYIELVIYHNHVSSLDTAASAAAGVNLAIHRLS